MIMATAVECPDDCDVMVSEDDVDGTDTGVHVVNPGFVVIGVLDICDVCVAIIVVVANAISSDVEVCVSTGIFASFPTTVAINGLGLFSIADNQRLPTAADSVEKTAPKSPLYSGYDLVKPHVRDLVE
jgi:hypothetical protein